jgi:hypothetical protein
VGNLYQSSKQLQTCLTSIVEGKTDLSNHAETINSFPASSNKFVLSNVCSLEAFNEVRYYLNLSENQKGTLTIFFV